MALTQGIAQKNINPLFDQDFLKELFENKNRTIFARITALTKEELPIEFIEGKVTGGSINIDGSSAVRRTCSLTMVAKEVNINDFYWGLKTKFKLEIGLKNQINSNYPDIIWFKQGIFVITSFSTSLTTNNYTINISGKDKMCLLNGDLGGALPHTTDFGVEEYYDATTGITTYTSIPIKTIVRESIQNFGNELAQNIIINDIEDAGLELLEYRGDIPLYLFREITSDTFINMTINENQRCYVDGEATTVNKIKTYDNLVHLEEGQEPTIVQLSLEEGARKYYVAKLEYGSTPGYRLTDLTYAGDLILNVGETITSLLDKIKNMLGDFEYFYNLDGKFVFQKKHIYNSIPWLDSENGEELPAEATLPQWSFLNSQLVSSFSNTPNLSNLRNDFAVWGIRKTTAGSELDIHMRYAIDRKPEKYHSLIEDKDYTIEDWDWRELIYQMALDYRRYYHDDDFLYRLAQANPQYPDGHTGYEQYYTDMEGFWRTLYNPTPEKQYNSVQDFEDKDIAKLFIKQAYRKPTEKELGSLTYKDAYILVGSEMRPFAKNCFLQYNVPYYYITSFNTFGEVKANGAGTAKDMLNKFYIDNLYIKDPLTQNMVKLVEEELAEYVNNDPSDIYIRDQGENYIAYDELEERLKVLYKENGQFLSYVKRNNFGEVDTPEEKVIEPVYYYIEDYEYDRETYWHNNVSDCPEKLLFWFDFLDADGSQLGKYSVPAVGVRSKALKDTNVKSIYYREVPKVIFQSGVEEYEHQTGYTYIQLQNTMENLFTISSKGKSAKGRIEELLQDYGYCIESANISTIPVYHLEPNSCILIQDDRTGISGEYIANKITIPLTHNRTMSITATKLITELL